MKNEPNRAEWIIDDLKNERSFRSKINGNSYRHSYRNKSPNNGSYFHDQYLPNKKPQELMATSIYSSTSSNSTTSSKTLSSNEFESPTQNKTTDRSTNNINPISPLIIEQKRKSNNRNLNMMPSVTSRLKKNISRTKEKILQGIGKTDRTSDESFDLYVENFDKQHSQANKLTKELNKYLSSLKETEKASKNFYETLLETYEPSWPQQNEFSEQVYIIENKWKDYINKLVNDVQMPLISYLNEFPELKKKIEKRDNRLLDFDNARHTLEGAQNRNNKKNNTSTLNHGLNGFNQGPANSLTTSSASTSTEQLTKLTRLKIDLEDKQHVYEELNQTLCMTLPVLYENRIKFYSSLLQTFFYTETIFNSDAVEVKSKLDTICENLSKQTMNQVSNSEALYYAKICQDEKLNGSLNPEPLGFSKVPENCAKLEYETSTLNERKKTSHLPADPPHTELNNEEFHNGILDESVDKRNKSAVHSNIHTADDSNSSSSIRLDYDSTKLESIESFLDKSLKHLDLSPILIKEKSGIERSSKKDEPSGNNSLAENGVINVEKTSVDRCLYKVRATYAYEAKELDELTFVKEDIINVIDGSESEQEELDEGWLIGVNESTQKRGLFPANFTKKI